MRRPSSVSVTVPSSGRVTRAGPARATGTSLARPPPAHHPSRLQQRHVPVPGPESARPLPAARSANAPLAGRWCRAVPAAPGHTQQHQGPATTPVPLVCVCVSVCVSSFFVRAVRAGDRTRAPHATVTGARQGSRSAHVPPGLPPSGSSPGTCLTPAAAEPSRFRVAHCQGAT